MSLGTEREDPPHNRCFRFAQTPCDTRWPAQVVVAEDAPTRHVASLGLSEHRIVRALYVSIGTAGALFTLLLTALARTSSTFTLAVLGENVFQSAAFAVEATIVLATIGEGNPLAATQFGLLIAAPNLPIAYMHSVDGAAYGVRGLSGALVADAGLSLVACAIAGLLLSRIQPSPIDPTLERRASSVAGMT